VFAPTYALVDERHGDTGDLTCLQRLGTLAGDLGASYVSTLPLLADYSTSDARDSVVSPYSPVSRMWWNEAYLDIARLPELESFAASTAPRPPSGGDPRPETPRANVALAGATVLASLERLRLLGEDDSSLPEGLRRFREDRPGVMRYAAFRAATQIRGIDRRTWPQRWRSGDIVAARDVPKEAVSLHVLAQWLTDTQIATVAAATSARGCRLMLDLPIGCRPDGYDTWAFPSSFAGGTSEVHPGRGVSVGAPPDRFFGSGQDWGFRPLDPVGERLAGYPVVRGALSHLLRHAGALRIDHVLGLERLWWIPSGASPSDGTYVSYPSEELVALACLEAWRRDAVLIGEDLGTVDEFVRRLMAEHGIAGMSVGVFDLEARNGRRLDPPAGACALVDTHDTATFAGWLDGTDIGQRLELGLLDPAGAASARAARAAATGPLVQRVTGGARDAVAVHAGVLEELGDSDAAVVIATLEDLWAEHEPQNIPGTVVEHANFTRRMARSLAEIENDVDLLQPLRCLDRARARHRRLEPATAGATDAHQTAGATASGQRTDERSGAASGVRACAPANPGRVAS
jgi:4-alpha-glucanotransferase